MNTSQFMDKQIMDLTSSSSAQQSPGSPPKQTTKDFIDLMNPTEDDDDVQRQHNHNHHYNGINREEILPNYDFQPIRPVDSSTPVTTASLASPTLRSWNSADLKSNSSATVSRDYGSLDSVAASKAKSIVEKDRGGLDASIVAEIDKTMKRHVDNLLHAMDGVSARLTQLETRTRNLENSVDDLKVSVGNSHGSTDGKMRQLENILREVQSGVQVLKDKQDIMEAHMQLAKLQVSKGDQQPSEPQSGQTGAVQQAASAPPQSHQQLPPVTFPQSIPPVPIPSSAVPTPAFPQQNLPPAAPLPNEFPSNPVPSVPQREPYYAPHSQSQEPANPQFQMPQLQVPQSSSAVPPHQPYPPAPQLPYSQVSQPSQSQAPLGHRPEEGSYVSPQSYPPSIRQPSPQQPAGTPPPPYYGAPPHVFEPPSSRPSSGFSGGYGPPTGSGEAYSYGGPHSQYGSSPPMKPQHLSSPTMPQSGGSGYPQLPTARILPQALPTASGVGSGSGSSGSGNRVPLDDVIDKVTSMGFPREHVRATVRKLTENGQSVDLNVVLDKLMNDGDVQPQRGWFGR